MVASAMELSEVEILRRVSGIVSSELTLEEMLGEVLGLAVRATACDACLVYLIDKDADEIVLRASQLPHAGELGNLRMRLGEGVTGWVAEHKAPVALQSNAASDERFKLFPALVEDTYQAFLSVPIVSGGESIGVINVHHRETREHSAEELALMVFLGEQTGNAIARARLTEENARLIEETQEMKRQLEVRKLVERAKGILQRNLGITEEEAYLRLRGESRRMRKPMRDLAEAIIVSEELTRKQPAVE